MSIYEYSELLDNLSESALAEYEISSILNEYANEESAKKAAEIKARVEGFKDLKGVPMNYGNIGTKDPTDPRKQRNAPAPKYTKEEIEAAQRDQAADNIRGTAKLVTKKGDRAAVQAKNKFFAVIQKIWEFIKKIGRWIVDKIKKIINSIRISTAILSEPVEIPKFFMKNPPAIRKITSGNAQRILLTLESYEKLLDSGKTVVLKAGDKLPKVVITSVGAWGELCADLDKVQIDENSENSAALNNCLSILKRIAVETQNLTNRIGNAATDENGKYTGELIRNGTAVAYRKNSDVQKALKKANKSKNESAEDIAYLRAQLLIEAADALADSSDDAGEPLPSVDEYDPEKGFTIAEDEDDITVSDEYVPEVSGGDDEETYPEDDDLEELEDLLEDDDDAMDIMTERDGTETIDAEPTVESILNFDFDDALLEGVRVPKVSSSFSGTDSEIEALYDELNDFIEDSKKAAHRSTVALLLGPLGTLNKVVNIYKSDTRYAKLEELAGKLRKSALKANGKDADKINAIADHIDRICDRRSRKLSAQIF